MKRISILLVLSVAVPGLCQGQDRGGLRGRHHRFSGVPIFSYGSSYDCAVRYSPYAFSYRSSGLIPGGVRYSPYAFTPGQSGLVYEGVRYTPYAFSYNESGLVLDYCTYPIPVCPVQVVVVPSPYPATVSETATARVRVTAGRSYGRAEQSGRDRNDDPMRTIRQYLAGRGFNSVDINYLWSVENRTVCASFILRDKGVAIRYSDPDATGSLDTASLKKSGERQQQAWEAFAKCFKAGGGSVYSIDASGKDRIIAALDACDALRPQVRPEPGQRNPTATETVRFAKK
jgi:hypothetical protein